MKKQIVVIPGGETFNNYKEYLSFLKSERLILKIIEILELAGKRT